MFFFILSQSENNAYKYLSFNSFVITILIIKYNSCRNKIEIECLEKYTIIVRGKLKIIDNEKIKN